VSEGDSLTAGLSDGVGVADGLADVDADGLGLGLGDLDGLAVGELDGVADGDADGLVDGLAEGLADGLADGSPPGSLSSAYLAGWPWAGPISWGVSTGTLLGLSSAATTAAVPTTSARPVAAIVTCLAP
jgi:hypothetical protein